MKLTGLGALGYVLISVYLWPLEVVAAIVNQTIDDQIGDSATGLRPIYFPAENVWINQTCGSNCDVNPSDFPASDGTYTAATYIPSQRAMGISMQFNGSAIYVFFILPDYQNEGVTTFTSVNFTIDGGVPVLFTHTPLNQTNSNEFLYNALVFAQTNLSTTLHTLNITVMGSANIYVNFDYALYTQDDIVLATSSLPSATTSTSQKSSASAMVLHSAAATSSRTSVGTIVGGIVGAVVVFVLVVVFLARWCRRGGYDALRPARWNGAPPPLITKFELGANPSVASGPGMTYVQWPVHSKVSIVTPQLANQTDYNSGYFAQGGTGPSRQNKSRTLLGNPNTTDSAGSHLNTREKTREEIRRERQEELDNRLRMVQQSMLGLGRVGLGISVSLRRRTSGEAEDMEEEADMSVPDMKEAIRSLEEEIRVLKEQQQSAWAQGLSDDPPPGYTPMETGLQNSRALLL